MGDDPECSSQPGSFRYTWIRKRATPSTVWAQSSCPSRSRRSIWVSDEELIDEQPDLVFGQAPVFGLFQPAMNPENGGGLGAQVQVGGFRLLHDFQKRVDLWHGALRGGALRAVKIRGLGV